ncbi:Methyl-accepting chemotaxis sensory transducer [Desulfatibacillum aliphaticivorans]|uniref:Methyl-accepting chemotaxis sensory transducer n=1 Tax=Desulfatibacillum aliphaticivorans TaxID=218208 RepID=B8F9C3_DESAL|nr:methyl-accepting chemotaxis protein [Desulfatibacillum aliphaticivorans]ACL02869.1 Methyl-accepting chemotaxis sensory transducer [Desulfatibacillum aliphaticivorans]
MESNSFWQRMTVGKRIAFGFAVVLVLLTAVGLLSFTGVGGIVHNAGMVIDGNKLDGVLAQREVDHLNWAGSVNALLTDENITELHVETDPRQCGFGKWLYGEGRKNAEALVPSLAPIIKRIEEPHARLHESAISIGKAFQPADANLPAYLQARQIDHLKWMETIDDLFLENHAKLDVITDDHQCALGKWLFGEEAKKAVERNPSLGPLLKALEEPHRQLHESAKQIQTEYRQIHPGLMVMLQQRLDDHRRWAAAVAQAILERKTSLDVETDPAKCAFGKFLQSREAQVYMASSPALKQALDACRAPHEALHRSAMDIDASLKAGDAFSARDVYTMVTLPALEEVGKYFNQAIDAEAKLMEGRNKALDAYRKHTLPALEKTEAAMEALHHEAAALLEGQREANQIYASQTMPSLRTVQELLGEIRQEAKKNIMTDVVMLDAAKGTKRNVSIVGLAAIIAGLFLAIVIARGIVNVLTRISQNLGEGADQVASASNQVAGSSQSLAEGASEQAASLEETSSSMEEMASMTLRNSENANQADVLMQKTKSVVEKASQTMEELTGAMEGISNASAETSKIIKTIDEIAFQTNLLALNAAVEAARAGEAGAGFAVVADEVRNLAVRAAEAAKNTTELIQGTVKRVEDGAQLLDSTTEAFGEVAETTVKVGEIVGEIAAASNEQTQGYEQIRKAVSEMDKVTQSTAANSEESASAAEELNAQAEQMKQIVEELMVLVGGNFSGQPVSRKALKGQERKMLEARKDLPALGMI